MAAKKAKAKPKAKAKAAPKKAAPKKAAPKSKAVIRSDARAVAVAAGGTPAGTLPGPRAASSFARTRGGYDPDTSIDYTNTNPGYWSSVKSFFENHSSNVMGETGIWIPNLEKEGAGATALAASAGGVRAIEGSNYARALPGEVPGAERAIQMESIFRGGEDKTTGYGGEKLGRLGKISPDFHGSSLLGGEVVKGPGSRYVSRGGDFGGLLGEGTAINTSMLDGLLGARDSDGMRIRGTAPGGGGVIGGPTGAATSDPFRGGGMGGISGGGPVVPTFMSDWSKFMPKNFSLGEAMYDTAGKEVAPGGFLYQPHAADYLGGMSSPGGGYGYGATAPAGRGLGGVPPVTYTPPSGFGAPRMSVGAPGGSAAAPGTRMGMTPGMHSTHLGAYESRPGVWVWGPRPGGVSDDPEAIAARGPAWGEPLGTTMSGHVAGSLGKMFGLLGSTEASRAADAADAEAEAASAASAAAGGLGGMGGWT